MKRIADWDPYFEVWDITHENILRLFSRGWQPCPKLTEQMKRRDGLNSRYSIRGIIRPRERHNHSRNIVYHRGGVVRRSLFYCMGE